jgi:hypothetical protein
MEQILERTHRRIRDRPMALHTQASTLGISKSQVQSSLSIYIPEVYGTEYPEDDKLTRWVFCTFKMIDLNSSGTEDRLETYIKPLHTPKQTAKKLCLLFYPLPSIPLFSYHYVFSSPPSTLIDHK